jgi:penicillin-binding protein 1A
MNPYAAAVAHVGGRLRSACSRRAVCLALPLMVLLPLVLATWGLAHHIYFDRSGVPDLEPFIRFELSTTGKVYDAQGTVLIELAREYRQVVSYEEVPAVLRQAILAAEDKNFFTHSGVDYRALPRVLYKAAVSSVGAWWDGKGIRLRLPQGGSTLTQQLVRGYFLREWWRRENDVTLFRDNLTWRVFSVVVGVPSTNKLFRKLEEVRLALWLEEEMSRRFGSREQAKREIFARSASFNYLGNGRYGFAAGSEYYFGKPLSSYTMQDAGKAALLAGITKAPRDYLPVPGDARPLRRRNEILGLMARNGYIPESLAKRLQAEPVIVAKATSPVKTHAPSAIDTVFDELKHHGAGRFGVEDLLQGRISVHATVDQRLQIIVNEALETGLALYEKRHPEAKGLIQGSVVVLRNADAAILAEAGGRHFYKNRYVRYSDFNRATSSLRQAGSAWKPMVYLAAFREGLNLDTSVPDEPIAVRMGADRPVKWIANYDHAFKGPIPMRQALAESRNAVAVWITREIGLDRVIGTSRELGIRTPLQPYITTALGASEVRLLELAGAYRAMASGILAEPYIVDRVTGASGEVLYEAARTALEFSSSHLNLIQEGLRGVVRIPKGTAHSLYGRDFPIPVMGKTGTTSDFRDALFVGSTYGPQGVTVAVRIGFDDNRTLGDKETGGRAALPIFREIMLLTYQQELVGSAPSFPSEIEDGIDQYLLRQRPDLDDPQLEDLNRSVAAPRHHQGEQSR